MLCYHGTSADNLPSVLQRGLITDPEKQNWTCSGSAAYFWSKRSLEVELGEDEVAELSEEDIDYRLKQMALDSATCALAASKNVKPVVVIVDIPEEWVEPDTSCDNMDYAEMCLTDVPYSYIKAILIGPDLGLFRGFFISSMLGREWSAHEFSDIEIRVAEALKEVWIDPEDIVNPEDLEEISLR